MDEESDSEESEQVDDDQEMTAPETNLEVNKRVNTAVAGPSTVRGSGYVPPENAHRPPLSPKDMNVKITQSGVVKKTRASNAQEALQKTRTVSGTVATGTTEPDEK